MTTQPSTLIPITLGRETMPLNEKKKKIEIKGGALLYLVVE